MACIITDLVFNFNSLNAPIPVPLVTVFAEPATTPLFLSSSSLFHEQSFTKRATSTDQTGQWSFTLPWPSEQDPALTQWIITLPDNSRWMGLIPQGVNGPLSLHTLKNTYGWGLISATNLNLLPVAVQGPPGPLGPYTPSAPLQWQSPVPSTPQEALDRLAAAVYALRGNTPIP
jgi:hypothetical protein